MRARLSVALCVGLVAGLVTGCKDDLCSQSTAPAIELTLEPAAGLDVSSVDRVRVRLGSFVLGDWSPQDPSVRPMTILLAFVQKASKDGGPSLPQGVELAGVSVTLSVELLAGTQLVAQGSVTFTPSQDACNFISVPLAAPSATPDAGPDAGGASDSGIDAAPGAG